MFFKIKYEWGNLMAKKIVALIMSLLPYPILIGVFSWLEGTNKTYSFLTFMIIWYIFFLIFEMSSFIMSVGSKAIEIITKIGGVVAKISHWAWYLIPIFPIDVFVGGAGLFISLFIVLEGYAILCLVTPVVCLISLIIYLIKK